MPAYLRRVSASSHHAAVLRSLSSILLAAVAASVNGAALPTDGDWPMAGRDYASTRYSPLADVTRTNVGALRVAFTFSTGVLRGHEGAPLVVGDTMYLVTPFPDIVYALDLGRPGAPLRWKFEPKPESFAQGVACCDVVNRGLAYADGRVFANTLDNQTIALNAANGKELWRYRSGDIRAGETRSMAPLVVKDRVLIGNSGAEFGVRGWIAALDASTGKEIWRGYSTGSDREVLIGPEYKPYYAKDKGSELGTSSWPKDAWRIGGGTVWGWISYDPESDLIFHGTANPAPWNAEQRPGDNKFTSGLFARSLATGNARWFYQFGAHDEFHYDAGNENVLVDLPLPGGARKALVHVDRNGYVYVFDRTSGQVISATPYVRITTSTGVDRETGTLHYAPEKRQRAGIVTRDICPASSGGKGWQPSAYSPRTRLLYIPHQNLCQDEEVMQTSYIAGTPYKGSIAKLKGDRAAPQGQLTAWDPVAARAAWTVEEELPVWSGALATAGDVVFYGTLDGWLKAVDATSGKALWQFRTGSGIVGQPIAYRGPDGKEYIAVLSGVGGLAGAVVANDLDVRDASAADGFANVIGDLKQRTTKGGMLYVFALP